MFLEKALLQKDRPDYLKGPRTLLGENFLVQHASQPRARALKCKAIGEPVKFLPEKFLLTGCPSCKNTSQVKSLVQRNDHFSEKLKELEQSIEKALEEPEDAFYGSCHSLSYLRSRFDSAWNPLDKEFSHGAGLVGDEMNDYLALLASQTAKKFFSKSPFSSKKGKDFGFLVQTSELLYNAPQLVVKYVPLFVTTSREGKYYSILCISEKDKSLLSARSPYGKKGLADACFLLDVSSKDFVGDDARVVWDLTLDIFFNQDENRSLDEIYQVIYQATCG